MAFFNWNLTFMDSVSILVNNYNIHVYFHPMNNFFTPPPQKKNPIVFNRP